MFIKNFKKFTGKHLCQSLFFNKVFIKKETLAQVFSCKFCEISKNTFFLQNTSGGCFCDYLIIFWVLRTFFFATFFFQKQASKDHLSEGNLLKTTLLNEKQSNLEKKMYGNTSLYSQYFSPGVGINVHITYFYFLKLTKKFFILSS